MSVDRAEPRPVALATRCSEWAGQVAAAAEMRQLNAKLYLQRERGGRGGGEGGEISMITMSW